MRVPFRVQTTLRTLLSLGMVLVLTAAGKADERDRLQGVWKLTRDHMAGREHKNVAGTWTIQGDNLTMSYTSTSKGTITLDPSKTPGRFERTIAERPDLKVKGTYRLERDTLKLYSAMLHRTEPPTDLPDEPVLGHQLVVWKRVDGTRGDGLDGEWKEVAFFLVGKRDIINRLGESVMRVRGDTYQIKSVSQRRCTIKIDPTQSPKHLDLTFEADALGEKLTNRKPRPGNLAALTFEADALGEKRTNPRVYRLDGDRLTVWQGIQGRPTEVSDAADSDNHFEVFERVKP